jgi:hypothetical protein
MEGIMLNHTIDVSATKNIREAISMAMAYASAKNTNATFVFNGTTVLVAPDAAFNDVLKKYFHDNNEQSMDKIRAKSSENQLALDKLVQILLGGSIATSGAMLVWLKNYTNIAILPDIFDCHTKEVRDHFEHLGYYSNMFKGSKKTWDNAVNSASFIIGKAMSHLEKDDPPNLIIVAFIDHWLELYAPPK